MPFDSDDVRPMTAYDAAPLLGRKPPTIHTWALRYAARKLGTEDGKTFYDFHDLVVIERELRHEHPVPATWQERSIIRARCPLLAADVKAA